MLHEACFGQLDHRGARGSRTEVSANPLEIQSDGSRALERKRHQSLEYAVTNRQPAVREGQLPFRSRNLDMRAVQDEVQILHPARPRVATRLSFADVDVSAQSKSQVRSLEACEENVRVMKLDCATLHGSFM